MSFSLYVQLEDTEITFSLAQRGWGTGGLIGFDNSAGFSGNNPFYMEGTDSSPEYNSLDSGSKLKMSIDNVYGQDGMSGKGLWAYRIPSTLTGGQLVQQPCSLIAVNVPPETYKHWRTPMSPIKTLDKVYIDWNDGYGLIEQTITTNYAEDAAENGLKTGKFLFTSVLATHAGTTGAMLSTNKVYSTFSIDAVSTAFKALREKDIQFESLSYDPLAMLAGNCYAGNLVKDVAALKLEVTSRSNSGYGTMAIGMLPYNKNLSDNLETYGGDSGKVFRDLRNVLGQPKRIMLIAHKSTEDVAAELMAVLMKLHPRLAVFLSSISTNQTENWSMTEQKDFQDNQINFVGFERALNNAMVVHVGKTLGTGKNANPAYIRCKDDILFSVGVAIVQLLAAKNTFMNMEGCSNLRICIRDTVLARATMRICDGFGDCYIPAEAILKTPTSEAAQALKTAGKFEQIEFTYIWAGNPEHVGIGKIGGI